MPEGEHVMRRAVGMQFPAKQYPKMTDAQKERFLTRIPKWVGLTAEQCDLARNRFQKFSNLSRREREEVISRWRQQQSILKRQQPVIVRSQYSITCHRQQSFSPVVSRIVARRDRLELSEALREILARRFASGEIDAMQY